MRGERSSPRIQISDHVNNGVATQIMPTPERSVICPILVGRQPDMQRLELLAAQAFAGRGQIALISGEAGIGKSRLVAELKARAQGRALILEGARFEADAARPFGPPLYP